MELKTFITETLNQIIDGVKDAQYHAAEQGGEVNPVVLFASKTVDRLRQHQLSGPLIQEIDFDVAVTATEGTKTKGGVGVFVGVVGLGTQGQSDTSNQSISRIKFPVSRSC